MTPQERALDQIKLTYLEQLEAGNPPSLDALIARHQEFRTELVDFVLTALELGPALAERDEVEECIPDEVRGDAHRAIEQALCATTGVPEGAEAPALIKGPLSAEDAAWLRALPVHEIIDRDCMTKRATARGRFEECLAFFGVSSPEEWSQVWDKPTAYRTAPAYKSNPYALSAWLRIGELRAAAIERDPFDATKFRAALRKIRQLTRVRDPEVWRPQLHELCRRAGVVVVIEQEIKGARINGAVRWPTLDRPVIILSLRHGWADIFWFTFFHEANHLLLHGRSEFITYRDPEAHDDPLEQEADAAAAAMLIPSEFNFELRRLRHASEVAQFADRIGVGPGIIVGRLQHGGSIGRNQLNSLRFLYSFA